MSHTPSAILALRNTREATHRAGSLHARLSGLHGPEDLVCLQHQLKHAVFVIIENDSEVAHALKIEALRDVSQLL